MVRLEKIVIQGFKSFMRKTSVPFKTGFSLITGPNGSGKSNIGDAITFVIGRGSSRIMRVKKAQDLIFHGSKSKKACDYASVTLYFENDGSLASQEKLVSVSRKINAKGVSTYRLDGRVVTKEQILDFFSQAGLSANGHNIIQQGDVTQIVEMDPIERREVIDEISGIMEYEDKKRKALKELEKTEEKVRESEIVLQEKESVIQKLSSERDAAMQYQTLTENLEKIKAALVWKEYKENEKGLTVVTEKIAEKEVVAQKLEEEIKNYDKQLEGDEKKLEELTKDVLKASSQIESTKKLAALRVEVEAKKDKIESNKREMERLDSMIQRLRSMDRRYSPAVKAVIKMKGVHGVMSDLLVIPPKYRVAVDVAAGGHMADVVVENTATAVSCVKYLKENRVGRARFLPLDKIRGRMKGDKPVGSLGWLSELVHFEKKLTPAMEFVFGSTACVKDVDTVKKISAGTRARMVTLDGDLMESSGAVTGGFYKKSASIAPELSNYTNQRSNLDKETEDLEIELTKMNNELEKLASKEKGTATTKFEKDRVRFDESLKKTREKRKDAYESQLVVQQELGKMNIKKARIEAKFENFKLQWKSYMLEIESKKKKETKNCKEKKPKKEQTPEQKESAIVKSIGEFVEHEVPMLKREERQAIENLNLLGPVNMKALQDFGSLKDEFDDFKKKVDKIITERASIEETISKIEEKKSRAFTATMDVISANFKKVYKDLTGGEAQLELEVSGDVNSGLFIKAQPPGKKLLNIDSMSGGEKTLTAFAFLFAIQKYKPAPFYMLDEADAALDARNTKNVAGLIKKQASLAQFIIISHNETLIREADQIYGVTMEGGESKLMGIELPPNGATTKNN